MQDNKKTRRKPAIRISQSDHARLWALANAVGEGPQTCVVRL